jgi:hypothetical protein
MKHSRSAVRPLATALIAALTLLATAISSAANAAGTESVVAASAKVSVSVTVVASTTAGSPFVVHAVVKSGLGRKLTFQHRTAGGVWHSDGTYLVHASGRVGRAYKGLPVGSYQFRAVLRASGTHKAVASGRPSLTVAPAPAVQVTFGLPSAASENQPFAFSYHVANAPAGARVVLQRQMGTASAWGDVMPLPLAGGSATAPGVPLGQYWYQVVVLSASGSGIGVQAAPITVFGTVQLSTLLGLAPSNTVVAGGHTFPYLFERYSDTTAIISTVSPCQSIHFDLARSHTGGDPTAVEQVTVTQQSADPTSILVPSDTITALNVNVIPGQSFTVSVTRLNGYADPVYFNGYANCFSTAGVAVN